MALSMVSLYLCMGHPSLAPLNRDPLIENCALVAFKLLEKAQMLRVLACVVLREEGSLTVEANLRPNLSWEGGTD
eukprot:scaffold154713_cov16-Prasinocladus_malaysianus.AAC.1